MADYNSNRWILLLSLFIALGLAVVGFGTPNWYRAVVTNSVSFTAGFFDVCASSTCFNYLNYLQLTYYGGDYIGCIVFHVFGIFLAAMAVLLVTCLAFNCQDDCVGPSCPSNRRRFIYVTWMALLGGICLLVTVIWFYVAVIRDGSGIGNLAGTFDLQADYSLGLSAAAGAILIVIALFMFLLRPHLYDDEGEHYEQRPKMMLEPVYRPPTPEHVRVADYEKPDYSRTIAQPTYRVEQPRPTYTVERPAPTRLSTTVRPPSPKSYRYTTAAEPAYATRATRGERRY